MAKHKPYTFVLGGRLLEHKSLIELRSDTDETQWEMIVASTIDFYIQLNVGYEINPSLMDRNDVRIMRMLDRTIQTIKSLDMNLYLRYYTEDNFEKYRKIAKDEIASIESLNVAFGDKPDKNSDITVHKETPPPPPPTNQIKVSRLD